MNSQKTLRNSARFRSAFAAPPAAALAAVAALALLALSGCATQSESGAVYSSSQTQREVLVRSGIVESVRYVTIEQPESGVGTIAGAVVGGVAGGSVGGGRGSAVAAVIGAVAGGIAGHAIEGNATRTNGLEITVLLENGEMRAVVQLADELFQPGERVRILSSGGVSRVTH